MSKLILLETSTNSCSAAIAIDGKVVSSRAINEHKAHAKLLVPFVKNLLEESNLSINDCSAVAISMGPGSYTGLRVGVSTAKGFCYGANLPLISVDTLEILARMVESDTSNSLIIPMIDARRMEVYSAIFNNKFEKLSKTEAIILDSNSFKEEFEKYSKLFFIGDGAMKFKPLLDEISLSKAEFIESYPIAEYMATPAHQAYTIQEFEDVAYFEPFYLKEFQAGVKKKNIIQP